MPSALAAIVARELRVAWRRPGDALGGLAFFVLVGTLFPLGVGPDPALLATLGPGVVWVAALLAVLLSLHRLFQRDLDEGVLEQLVLAPSPLALTVAAKVAAHWLVACLPLAIVGPLIALQYGLTGGALAVLLLALLVGTPTLALLGALGAALTLGLRGHLLLAVVVLPWCVPVLVFGSGAVAASQQGLAAAPQLGLLLACLLLAGFLCPWATGAALRLAVE